ncbi:MAG: YbaB/EbfC family nucleoid-associated protein [Acidimicrobiales bacterium]|nr:YbaB/EbfC family nucleoid-associated protein [Acidimicrobiales bacterium]
MADFGDLLRQANQMQEQLLAAQAAAAEEEVEGHAGGGMVKITASGGGVFTAVHIDPQVVDPDDVGMLEDLVLAALHDTMARVQELQRSAMGELDLGGLGGLLGQGG